MKSLLVRSDLWMVVASALLLGGTVVLMEIVRSTKGSESRPRSVRNDHCPDSFVYGAYA